MDDLRPVDREAADDRDLFPDTEPEVVLFEGRAMELGDGCFALPDVANDDFEGSRP